ncbi:transketolase family protein [Anaerocolumna sp. MB42-C2]|uniref:transketolase family protein n=1 Tax=Anaerocolumna sp. MB42-C2 TaxID=3070997 RepID=UPI0027E0E30E|nr:transketolase C-terminal domain-containing protein [Anaerocolumna sp. MB42-C2]WMJ87269.1 transketolase C-terminal domain-containing protein [Anaerocolumna sp. MB42-C2]
MAYTNQRMAYGNTLVELGKEDKRIVVLDADLGGSTMGKLFETAYPERHFEMGIAEANMTSVAAGLAQTGKIPFTNSFAVFAGGRAYDQIRQTIAIGKLNVKICGSSSGMSDFGDGATHQAIEDMAIMRAIPNMTVICPADANETIQAVKAMVELDGPCYLRLNRNDYENVTPEDKPFVIGMPSVLKEGSDIVVFATGIMVCKALEAAEELKDKVSVKVVNVSTIKPMNKEAVIKLVEGCKAVVTVEEHNIVGGLGSAVSEVLCKECKPIEYVGVEDTFGGSGHNYNDVLEYYGLTKEHIMEAILKMAEN